MKLENLMKLASCEENTLLAFGHSLKQLDKAAKTVCAMLNSHGGLILYGVSKRGELVGEEVAKDDACVKLADAFQHITPTFPIDVKVIPLKNKRAVFVQRLPASEILHTYFGVCYQRRGKQNKKIGS